ncbi:unnamed protein product [Boreogadus saida]
MNCRYGLTMQLVHDGMGGALWVTCSNNDSDCGEVLDDGFKRLYFQTTSSGDANEMTSSPSSATMDELPPDELLIPVSRLTPLSPSVAPLKGLCAGLIAMHIKRQSRGS